MSGVIDYSKSETICNLSLGCPGDKALLYSPFSMPVKIGENIVSKSFGVLGGLETKLFELHYNNIYSQIFLMTLKVRFG